MTLAFRNVDVTPDDPVEEWGFEGMLAAIDRGSLSHWHRIVGAIRRDPWGDVAQTLEEALAAAEDSGVVGLLERAQLNSRTDAARHERQEVARLVRAAITSSGMSQREFARRIGTSASRLSTYASGSTTPSASLLLRIEKVAELAHTKPVSVRGGASAEPSAR